MAIENRFEFVESCKRVINHGIATRCVSCVGSNRRLIQAGPRMELMELPLAQVLLAQFVEQVPQMRLVEFEFDSWRIHELEQTVSCSLVQVSRSTFDEVVALVRRTIMGPRSFAIKLFVTPWLQVMF